MTESKPRRFLEFEGGQRIEIGKVTEVNMPKKNLYIEEMPDGRFRLTYSTGLITDAKQLEAIRLVREDQ